MKRMMATMMVVGMTMASFGGVAMAAEPTEAPARMEWSEGTQAKIDEARENREENRALREEIKGQHETIRELLGARKGAVRHDLKEALGQRREVMEAKREGHKALRDQMAEVKEALKEGLQSGDQEKAGELKAELQTLRSTAEAEFGDWKAEVDALKADLEALKGDREMARAKREELKPLFDQARAIHEELKALRAEAEPVRAAMEAARESQDDATMSAALDDLLPLQEERHTLLSDLNEVLDQIIGALD